MVKKCLEERVNRVLSPLFNYIESQEDRDVNLRFGGARNYKGIIDYLLSDYNLFEEGSSQKKYYILLIDREHPKGSIWRKSLKVLGTSFKFHPNENFRVEGRVLDSGNNDGFEFYLVRISKYSKK